MKFSTCTSLLIAIHILGTQCLNEKCNKNSDCTNETAICRNGKCNCANISYYNETTQRCLPYVTEYNDYCQESEQCTWLGTHSGCKGNRCVCTKGFRWFQGKCQQFVDKGSTCKSDSECYNGYDMLSMKCSEDHICTCNNGYYDRDGDCRRESSSGGDCALDIDCSRDFSKNLHCELGHCKKSAQDHINTVKYFPPMVSGKENYIQHPDNITCSFDDDCRDMANSQCDGSTGTCRCKANTYLCEGNCSPGFKSCNKSNNSCSGVDNTICFKDTCICKQGYFMNEGKCVPELGMTDSALKDCVIKPGRLIDSTCYCKEYWFNDESNRNCIKTTLQQTKSCLTSDWCNAMGPYTTCNATTSKCQCSSFAKLNESSFYCFKVEDPPKEEGFCMRNSDCPLNERCLDEKCECINNFSRYGEGSTCLPDVGGSCDMTGCSHIKSSRCSGVCKCIENYTGTKNKCLKVVDKLDGSCEDSIQCEKFDHGECGPSQAVNKTCICSDRYLDVGNMCMQMKEYGNPCMKETDCTLVLNRSFQCRNNKCLCRTKYVLKDGYCTSSSATFFTATSILIFFLLILRVT